VLVVARFIQGIGGAMTSAVILGVIVTMFTEPRDQAKAIGVFAFVASAGGSIGLLVGGVLTESINWHWIFFVNIPIGIGTAIAARRLLAPDKGIGFGSGADILGAVLVTSALMLGVYTIVSPAAEDGWGSARALGFGAASLVLLAAFILREARAANPLVPLRIFRSRNVSGANIAQVLLVAGMFGMFFLGSLYLQRVLGYTPLEIGFAFLPTTLVMGTLSIKYSERLVMRYGARRVLLPGLAVMAIGLAWFTQAPVDGGYAQHVLPVLILLGLGVGLAGPALVNLAMSGATQQDAGLASGLVNTSAQVGGALGLAVLATLSATRTEHLLAQGKAPLEALTGGYHLAFWIAAALVVAAIGVTLTVIAPDKAPADQRAREGAAGEPAYSEG
jgi:MFS family permease